MKRILTLAAFLLSACTSNTVLPHTDPCLTPDPGQTDGVSCPSAKCSRDYPFCIEGKCYVDMCTDK